MNKQELSKLSKKKLLEIAKKWAVTGRHAMRKAELVQEILAQQKKAKPSPMPAKKSKPSGKALKKSSDTVVRRAKFELGAPGKAIDEDVFVPASYQKTEIQLLVKNPTELFAYWDVARKDVHALEAQLQAREKDFQYVDFYVDSIMYGY